MSRLFRYISMTFAYLLGKVGLQKEKNLGSEHDAIMFPYQSKHGLMEDYEIAAYHNQA